MRKNIVSKSKLSDSLSVSKIITGLWQIADMERDDSDLNFDNIAKEMKFYVDYGLSTFDMADHYGSAELISGVFNQKFTFKNEVQFLTKWVPKPGPISRKDVDLAIDHSLDRMKSEKLDLIQFHAWNYYDPAWLDALFFLQELKDEGKIKNIGVTNFDTIHLRIALTSGIEIVSNQISYSLIDQRAKFTMTDLCNEFNVYLLAYGTLAGGFLSEKWINKSEPNEALTWSQMKYKRFIKAAGGWEKFQDLLNKLNKIAKHKKVSIANIATKYILNQPQVGSVIIGARLGENSHIQNNLNIFNFELTKEESSEIEDAMSILISIPGDCGDEYRKPPFLTASGDLSHHVNDISVPYESVLDGDKNYIISGTEWEDSAGYCRAIKKNNRIFISGTTAIHKDKNIGGDDLIAQTHFIIDKIFGIVQSLGGKEEDIVRTRIYVNDLNNWETIARIHGDRFNIIKPSNTLIRAELVGKEYLVEIEADAELT